MSQIIQLVHCVAKSGAFHWYLLDIIPTSWHPGMFANVFPSPKQEVDIYRDTPVRLLGYANEVGEAFRALVHVNWVRLSYGVASSYVLADTYDKAKKMQASGSKEGEGWPLGFIKLLCNFRLAACIFLLRVGLLVLIKRVRVYSWIDCTYVFFFIAPMSLLHVPIAFCCLFKNCLFVSQVGFKQFIIHNLGHPKLR